MPGVKGNQNGFKKGQSGNKAGKPKGTQNKLTRTVKECLLEAFNKLQDDPKANLVDWGIKNPGLFYQIASKLIPTEIKGQIETTTKQVFKIGNTTIEF